MTPSEQLDSFQNTRMFGQSALIKNGRSTQRQQTNHGTNLQLRGITIWEVKQIVEKAVLLIPHFVVLSADTIHCIGNPDEVLKEPVGYILIDRIIFSQNQRNLQHA